MPPEDGMMPPHGEEGMPPEDGMMPPHGEEGMPPEDGMMPPHGEEGMPPEGDETMQAVHDAMKESLDGGATPEEAFSNAMNTATDEAAAHGASEEDIAKANEIGTNAFNEAMANGASAEEAFGFAMGAVGEAMGDEPHGEEGMHHDDGMMHPEGKEGMPPEGEGEMMPPEGEHMDDGKAPPPDPDGYVNDFIAPLFDGTNGTVDTEAGTWTLPISSDSVNVEDNSFVISADAVGDWGGEIPPEATDNGDGTYTINSWPIDSLTDNGDGTVTLNISKPDDMPHEQPDDWDMEL